MTLTLNQPIQANCTVSDPSLPSGSAQSLMGETPINGAHDPLALVGSQLFARAIEDARQEMLRAPWLQYSPNPEAERAAAQRQLRHQIAAALDQGFVLHDPDFPEFSRLDKHNQFGLVNPDNLYLLATIKTPGTYVIHGTLGTTADVQIQVGAGDPGFNENLTSPIPVSELDLGCLSTKPNREFTILISDTEPADLKRGENWLCNTRCTPTGKLCANSILIRESLMNWETETGSTWRIERVDTVGQPNPLPTAADVDQQYDRAARYLTGSTRGWIKFVEGLRVNLSANRMSPARATGQGGLPGQYSAAGHFQMTTDTAFIITIDESDARYQGIQIGDLWFNALDFRRRQTSLTTTQAYKSEDGKYRFVLSVDDPGFENWLDPAGATTAFVFMRWQGILKECDGTTKAPNSPDTLPVPFHCLEEKLKSEPRFSPEQRQEQLAKRHVSALRIPRGF